ncbi:MAG: hypothetical protein AGIKBDMD_00289 [Synergistaceae bacterium]
MQIECPECSKMISDKADVCPHCGYPVKKIEKEAKKKEANQKANKGCMIFFMVFLVMILYGFVQKNLEPVKPPVEPGDIDAYVMSQRFVKDLLGSPERAKFPYMGDAYEVTKLDSVTWRVYSYVDSPNRLGLMKRKKYKAKFMYLGDFQWKLLDLKFIE